MLDRFAIARALRDTAMLLDLKGENSFKARAYNLGAAALEELTDDLGRLVREKKLTSIKGVGASLAGQIEELYNTGRSQYLERLQAEMPPGIIELAQVPGLSIKKIQQLHESLGISSIDELKEAALAGKVRGVKGFGEKTERNLLEGIEQYESREDRELLLKALEVAERLAIHMRAAPGVVTVDIAGSIRRWKETARDIDVLVSTHYPGQIVEHLLRFPLVSRLESESANHAMARLANGMRVDLVICQPDTRAVNLLLMTGSVRHVERLQQIAAKRGLVLGANGVEDSSGVVRVKTEKDIYKLLGLPFIPPELREDEGEFEAARQGDMFLDLISEADIRGMVHCHTVYSDGRNTVAEMARAVKQMGWEYITITDHSPAAHYAGGLTRERLFKQWEEIERVRAQVDIDIMRGTESDILEDGSLDYPPDILGQFDVIIGSIHNRMKMDRQQMTQRLIRMVRNPHFKIWGHALGRLVLRRPPVDCDVEAILEAAASSRVAIEVNADPYRLDMEPRWLRKACRLGLKFVISTDAHAIRDLHNLGFGIHLARRAGIRRDEVLNALSPNAFRHAVAPLGNPSSHLNIG